MSERVKEKERVQDEAHTNKGREEKEKRTGKDRGWRREGSSKRRK